MYGSCYYCEADADLALLLLPDGRLIENTRHFLTVCPSCAKAAAMASVFSPLPLLEP